MDIKIKAKLKAYTKGVLPTKLSDLENDEHFIQEAPLDGSIYGRKLGTWQNIDKALDKTVLEVPENSGLNLSYEDATSTYTISVRQENITELDLPNSLENDTVYYVENLHASVFIDGGTSFSEGNNEYITLNEFSTTIDGGVASTINFNNVLLPLNSKGVYEEWQI